MSPHRVAFASLAALLVLQLLWRSGLLGVPASSAAAIAILVLPLLALLGAALMGRPAALFWSGLLALLYFSHGVVEIWAGGEAATLGWAESGISVLLIGAIAGDGLQRRRAARRAGKTAAGSTPRQRD